MKAIIREVELDLIKQELTSDRLLRKTNKGGNEIYVVNAHNAPNVMREIGRLREIAFRTAGGGTGKDCDIDEYDTMEEPCQQLVVWNPEGNEIIGGYRFILGENVRLNADGVPHIATSHMFRFSKQFIEDYLPSTLELGRSFVRLEYQSSKAGAKAIYALDNLWDGIGALTVVYPQIKSLFGKVTMYPNYSHLCRDMILYFMNHYFPDRDHLVTPIVPVKLTHDIDFLRSKFVNNDFAEDYRRLNKLVREEGLNVPPLVHAYMSLSPTMKMFGTAINDEFGNVEESGIMILVSEITAEKIGRHVNTFNKDCSFKK
ncbi:MAG: GNAT family N-acetyltransferase [Bacteroidales bacterium]|nr:GNAT family N-acetyltransferase [Bacteroidales bacterium]